MILMIDNYDSFTYNIVQYFGELGHEVDVRRNDALTVDDVVALRPRAIVISPGPCSPAEAGISVPVIERLSGKVPILGVCLGHQSITHAMGGRVIRAGRVMHGKTSPIVHEGDSVFAGLPSPFRATRYHSLVAERSSFPESLVVTATAGDDGEIMGLRHRVHPTHGVQFHPESILTEHGHRMLGTFLSLADAWWAGQGAS
jgi:anthranilate synthase/aminodeoxychorismate synthase-like glutamine amidotransferase